MPTERATVIDLDLKDLPVDGFRGHPRDDFPLEEELSVREILEALGLSISSHVELVASDQHGRPRAVAIPLGARLAPGGDGHSLIQSDGCRAALTLRGPFTLRVS